MYVSIPEVMVVSLSCIKYYWPLFYGFFFVFCGCTERKISPDPTSWKTNNEELIRRLQKGNQETHLIIQNLVTKVDILERRVLELELERSKTEKIIEKQDKRLQFLGSLSPRQTNLDNPEEPVLYDERRSNSFVTVEGPTLQTAEPIVFHSYLSRDSLPNLSKDHVITFDSNPVNEGHGYHKDNGIFEAPRAGTYVFFWTIYTYPRGFIRTELLVNGEVVGGAQVDCHPDDGITSTTGMVITYLRPGDHVYVRLSYTAQNYIFSYPDGRSTFSGWLLH